MENNNKQQLRIAFNEFLQSVPENLREQIPNLPLELEIFDSTREDENGTFELTGEEFEYIETRAQFIGPLENQLHLIFSVVDQNDINTNLPNGATLDIKIEVYPSTGGDRIDVMNVNNLSNIRMDFNTKRKVVGENYIFTATLTINGQKQELNTSTIMDLKCVIDYALRQKSRNVKIVMQNNNLTGINMVPPTR